MAWLTSLLKKPETAEPEAPLDAPQIDEEKERPVVQLKAGPQLAVLAPDIGGISSFRLQFFPDAGSAAHHVEELFPEARRGTHAFWALHDEPHMPAGGHREALVLIRANHTSDVVYVVSFTDLESAWSFARFETKRGLDPSHLVIYWAAFATVREELNGVTILPSAPPATTSLTAATLAPPPVKAAGPAVSEAPTETEEEAEAAYRAQAARAQAAEAAQLAEAAHQAEAEAARIAEEARAAAIARGAEEARIEAEADAARAEALRVEAEAETARAEAARIAAETEAVRAEATRIEAEAARAEAARVEATRRVETVRQVQADARALAEATRIAEESRRAEILDATIEGSLQLAPPLTVGTPPEPITSYPGDEEAVEDAVPGDVDEPAAVGTVFLHPPAETEGRTQVEIPPHLRKGARIKKRDIPDPTAGLPTTTPLDEFDIAYEVERLLTNRRWDKRQEPFNGFKSPPGRF